MKKTILNTIAICTLLGGLTSCGDEWLGLTDPNRETASTFWKTSDQFNQGLTAAYSTWRRPGYFSRWFQVLTVIKSDEGWSNSPNQEFIGDATFVMDSYNYDSNEGLNLPWQAMYNSLYYVNQVIDNMNDHGYSLFSKEEADKILGQGYFIRGVAFWSIAGIYGAGPLAVSSTGTKLNTKIANQEELYKQALEDFTLASKLLPTSWPEAEAGRATKGGALGMMAKMNMQLAGMKCHRPWDAASQSKTEADAYWTAAKSNIEEIFKLGIYDLVPNWIDNFTEANENNKESLFEINFKEGTVNGKEVGNQRPKFLGLYAGTSSGLSWDDGSAREWLLDEFNKERDKDGNVDMRKFHTLFYYDESEPETTTAVYYGKTWQEWNNINKFEKKCYWKKYTSVENDPSATGEGYVTGVNIRILRLADVYLMYAECLNELNGDRKTAVEYINKVRRRVNMRDLDATLYNSYDALMDQIKHERLVELCGECQRWFDLDRWGDLHSQEKVNALAERDKDFRTYRVGISHLWCIPNHEINLWEGFKQNPGY